ncbi:ATP-dependent RNA helicase DOB1 [Nematocida major]|uniref:ATP-dependent RNA helicase DOB1 n=1 Tax=Nematocida major TaxID=1912982 RepID=UPI002007B4CE|nr:ATP-dependent RNA helicase DOB1 [Nematocida major]KAH9386550.1 ATP-dependent RNA helicase DOB1 [Nematocida major]
MKTSESLFGATQHISVPDVKKNDTFLDTAVEVDSFVETNDDGNTVRHNAIVPENMEYTPLASTHFPIQCEYPFKLDKFQVLALQCLERDESLLVSAHTSAGKTLIAEYAIHLSIQKKQRVIYTSPIKALSNQKYRELNEKFGDVGLMTGDVTLNPDSTCIVMTTEILRNMIYKGTEILRETHFVVFDEVHYMRDRERGVVWEETIILLPSTTRFIFLSATIPNAEEFARWIVSIHRQPCHVIYTEKRPTPLEHYIYANAPGRKSSIVKKTDQLRKVSDQISLVVDKAGTFQTRSMALVQKNPGSKGGYGRRREQIDVVDILQILKQTNNLPTIIFSFRRKECEQYAKTAEGEFDFASEEEKNMIDTIFNNALNTLREEDRKLPQILGLKALLMRGIGVHHSGLMPIVKEIIEILFQENLLKVLFATETFSIGLNMPAKSVVFTSIKKFDGVQTRFITSGEYIQMSGRAGRRGTDKIGNVVLALESGLAISEKEIKKVLHGPSNTLDSAFRLSYNTILNILRLDGVDEDYVIKHSFLQFRCEMRGKALYLQLLQCLAEYERETKEYADASRNVQDLEQIEKYFEIRQQEAECAHELLPAAVCNRLLLPGRIVEVEVSPRKTRKVSEKLEVEYSDVLLGEKKVLAVVMEKGAENVSVMTEDEIVREVSLQEVKRIAKTSVEMKAKKATAKFFREFFSETKRKNKKLEQSLSFYSAPELGVAGEVSQMKDRLEEAADRLYDQYVRPLNPLEKDRVFKLIESLSYRSALRAKIETLAQQKEQTRLIMIDEYNNKRRILQGLSYLSEQEVLIKGKVASEISSGDELLLTEMLFNNEFSKLSPGRICSLLSCVVFDDKSDKITLTPASEKALKILTQTVERLSMEFERLDTGFKAKEYAEKFCSNLMDVVYRWTEGYSFADICETTEVFEGSIIRCFRRLEEVLKEMARASKVIGNVEMENKFSAAISLVKRDIVFANSLYL